MNLGPLTIDEKELARFVTSLEITFYHFKTDPYIHIFKDIYEQRRVLHTKP